MTFKDLQKLVQLQANPEQVHLFDRPMNKASWFGTSKCISKKILKIKENVASTTSRFAQERL